MVTKMFNLLKNNIWLALMALAILANFGVLYFQNNKIKTLQTKNEVLKAEIQNKNNEITELNSVILNQNTAIDEMVANANEKENLNKELKSIREQILKDLKQNDEIINQPLRDSVDFIVKRLREQENAK